VSACFELDTEFFASSSLLCDSLRRYIVVADLYCDLSGRRNRRRHRSRRSDFEVEEVFALDTAVEDLDPCLWSLDRMLVSSLVFHGCALYCRELCRNLYPSTCR